jgi:outer membrane lipoprotein SlyB
MKTLVLIVLSLFVVNAHAQWSSDVLGSDGRKASEYARSEGLLASNVTEGVVLQSRPVSLQASGTASALGTALGAGLLAHSSRNASSYAARGVAVALGGIAGALTAGAISRDQAIEVLVRLKDNSLQAIVQGADAESANLVPGTRVAMVNTQGKTRVVRISN